jgi:phosphatidylinositol alpha-mannosyltransferase
VQVCVREIAGELKKRGHYVRIIAPKPRKKPEHVDEDIILIGNSTEVKAFATKTDVGLSTSNEAIDQMLQEQQFDVIHFHEPGAPLLGMQLVGRSKTAHVATMHATLPQGMVTKSYQKLMQPVAKYIETRMHVLTAVSSVAEATARVYIPDADTEVTIIPNGIRLKDFLPATKRKETPIKTIVYIGRLEKRKGVKYLLKAYAELRQHHNKVRLIIAGQGDLRPSLGAMVERYDIPDVKFVGFVSDKEKIRLLQTADLYCSPAIYGESFGIVLLEAMAAGCVTVAGNNPGYASVMTGRGRLSLVNPESTLDFAHRLELMLLDETLRKEWLKWAKTYVQQFDYSTVVDQYEAAYRKAMRIHKQQKSL